MLQVNNNLNMILKLTKEMLEKAEAQEWEDVISLEDRRSTMLRQSFGANGTAAVNAESAAFMHQLCELNTKILDISTTHRQQLVKVLAKSSRQRHAANVYRRTNIV